MLFLLQLNLVTVDVKINGNLGNTKECFRGVVTDSVARELFIFQFILLVNKAKTTGFFRSH